MLTDIFFFFIFRVTLYKSLLQFSRNFVTFYDTYVQLLHTFSGTFAKKFVLRLPRRTFHTILTNVPLFFHLRDVRSSSFLRTLFARQTSFNSPGIRCRVCTRLENCLPSGVRGTVFVQEESSPEDAFAEIRAEARNKRNCCKSRGTLKGITRARRKKRKKREREKKEGQVSAN